MNIYAKLEKPRTLRQLLEQFFTINNGSYVCNVATYKDKECTTLQCYQGKYRSFDDVLTFAKTYFPSTTPKKLLSTLLTLKIKDKYDRPCELYMFSCHTIRRINLFYAFAVYQYGTVIIQLKYESKYSWKQLLDMVGIKSQEQLVAFREKKK